MTFDSSRTRVAPVFNYLQAYDPTGRSWLGRLLGLANTQGRQPRPPESRLMEACWWPREKPLKPPIGLLERLVRNPQPQRPPEKWGTRTTRIRREELVARTPETIGQALELLRTAPSGKKWYILEGASKPDAFLATSDVVVVIEGKRTESAPTTVTDWMPVRHQMLRHLDGALEVLDGRRLYGFFIVEALDAGGAIPEEWQAFANATVGDEAVNGSLPHRGEQERNTIQTAFLGVTTWQAICNKFQIPHEVLIPEVLD